MTRRLQPQRRPRQPRGYAELDRRILSIHPRLPRRQGKHRVAALSRAVRPFRVPERDRGAGTAGGCPIGSRSEDAGAARPYPLRSAWAHRNPHGTRVRGFRRCAGRIGATREMELPRVSKAFGNDILLALSCREAGAVLVTDNLADFERIARVTSFDFVEPWPAPARA